MQRHSVLPCATRERCGTQHGPASEDAGGGTHGTPRATASCPSRKCTPNPCLERRLQQRRLLP
eukprot:1148065-Prorocentrum_lima.AAC.1